MVWLRAQLDDDERVAKAAAEETAPSWRAYYRQVLAPGARTGEDPADTNTAEVAVHMARHDPARVLRRIERDRLILDRYEDTLARIDDPEYSTVEAAQQAREYEDFVLPALALPYADREGCPPEWRP